VRFLERKPPLDYVHLLTEKKGEEGMADHEATARGDAVKEK
jgi:hypothetical protein